MVPNNLVEYRDLKNLVRLDGELTDHDLQGEGSGEPLGCEWETMIEDVFCLAASRKSSAIRTCRLILSGMASKSKGS